MAKINEEDVEKIVCGTVGSAFAIGVGAAVAYKIYQKCRALAVSKEFFSEFTYPSLPPYGSIF